MDQIVVVLPDRRRRETGVGWCWPATSDGHQFEVLVPDAVLDRLDRLGLSPFAGEPGASATFFEKLELAARRRLASLVRKPSLVVVGETELGLDGGSA